MTGGVPRRVDASKLLYEVMRHPLDPGYELAARDRDRDPDRRRPLSRGVVTMVLAVFLAFVTVSAVRDLRAPEPETLRLRRSLEQQIEERTRVVKERQEANATLHQAIAYRQDEELTQRGAAELATRMERLSVASGELPVHGPGVELTFYDAESEGGDSVGGLRDDPASIEGKVVDRDLQVVVNGMWVAGAEAVSVNAQRLTALSAIRGAGQAILVDYRPLVPPYVIRAIGDPAQLQAGFAADLAGSYIQTLRNNYGITSTMDVKDTLTVPGAGEFSLHWAQPEHPQETGYPFARPGADGRGTAATPLHKTHSTTDTEVSP